MIVYISIVELTIASELFLITSINSFAVKKPSIISLKILVKEVCEGSGKQSTLKCLVNRGVN